MLKGVLSAVLAGTIVGGTACRAEAGYVVYSDRASWLAAVKSVQSHVDFNDMADDWFIERSWGTSQGPYDAGPFTISEVGTQTNTLFIDVPPYAGGYGNIDGTAYLRASIAHPDDATRVTRFQYDFQVYAWGADLKSQFPDFSTHFNFIEVGGAWKNTPTTNPTFFGIVSTDPFTTIDITGSFAGTIGIDNRSTAVPTPEPGSMLLLLIPSIINNNLSSD